jgi:hypothetical protein
VLNFFFLQRLTMSSKKSPRSLEFAGFHCAAPDEVIFGVNAAASRVSAYIAPEEMRNLPLRA